MTSPLDVVCEHLQVSGVKLATRVWGLFLILWRYLKTFGAIGCPARLSLEPGFDPGGVDRGAKDTVHYWLKLLDNPARPACSVRCPGKVSRAGNLVSTHGLAVAVTNYPRTSWRDYANRTVCNDDGDNIGAHVFPVLLDEQLWPRNRTTKISGHELVALAPALGYLGFVREAGEFGKRLTLLRSGLLQSLIPKCWWSPFAFSRT